MEVPLDAIREINAQAQLALDLIEEMEAVEIPQTLDDAIRNNWIGLYGDLGEEFFGDVDQEEMEKWSRRLISIENANIMIATLEKAFIESFVERSHSPLYRMIQGFTAIPRWFLEHAHDVWTIILPILESLLVTIVEYETRRVAMAGILARIEYLEANPSPENDAEAGLLAITHFRYQAEQAEIEIAIYWAAAAVAVLFAFYENEQLLALFANRTTWKNGAKQPLEILAVVERATGKLAFPQAIRHGWRRRKASR